MIITIRKEKFYKVEMTSAQRADLIFGLLIAVESGERLEPKDLSVAQKEVMQDLRVSLLNAA